MTWRIAVGFFVVTLGGSSPLAQQLDDAAVAAAIEAGHRKNFKNLISDCNATEGFGASMASAFVGGIQPNGAFTVITALAQGRIAFAAAESKRLYKPFSLVDVPPELRATGTVFVTAVPHAPTHSGNHVSVASPIEHIVLKAKHGTATVQPTSVTFEPIEWSNLLGGTVSANSAIATFPMAEVRELPLGEIDVVLVTVAGERRCKIGNRDRARLFGAASTHP